MEEIIRNSSFSRRSKRQIFDSDNEIETGVYNQDTRTFSYPGVPDSVNWVEAGLFNEVRDQGKCGSCWAYATTALVEAYYKKLYGTSATLSEQNLIDCNRNHFSQIDAIKSKYLKNRKMVIYNIDKTFFFHQTKKETVIFSGNLTLIRCFRLICDLLYGVLLL